MSSLIQSIAATKTVVFGCCQKTKANAGKSTLALRTWNSTRLHLAWLAARLEHMAHVMRHVVGVPSAALALERSASSRQCPRSGRPRRPGSVPVSQL